MSRPLITLTTDFGSKDHFVGTMKGVILGICPQAAIVDISHEITPFEIAEAGFVIAQAYRYFPKQTVHVVVVDPGVGTSRRPILAEAAGQYFIAPDNGVLSMIYARETHKVRVITAEKLFLRPVSQTFHGRDVFAPVAAHLARGARPAKLGKLIRDYLRSDFDRPTRTGKRYWTGRILKIDRFGNLITNFPAAEFSVLERRPFELTVGPHSVRRLVHSYAEGGYGELVLIAGSTGFLEIATNQASAAQMIGCAVGAQAELAVW
ncbi:MAG: SAM-dependent chlorinase/fluorinase [Bryobacterales bacterium]|nr:SAM-dependent chlorinase/fluorinase [Bryobacteraceae bacterium]MDW8354536.1 SAM-dependent chlorinase/fluorinase [Bryobacterales bacterium]